MKRFYFFIILSAIPFISFSQYENIVEIDRTTGNHTHFGPSIAGVTIVFKNSRAYNENNGIFIFPCVNPSKSLFSIDVSNDSIISSPLYSLALTGFEYCNSLNTLFGFFRDTMKYFVSINTTTGSYTKIGNPISGTVLLTGYDTFNQNNNIYICILPSKSIISIDATNGNIISNPALVLANGENIANIVFNNMDNTLYGLMQDNNVNKYFLVSINTTTGICTKIGTGTTFGYINSSAAIDEVNNQYIFLYDFNAIYQITTLDISTGSLLYHNILPTPDLNENFINLEFDNIRGKLYAMHWDELEMSIEETQQAKIINKGSLYQNTPNPFDGSTVIRYFIPEINRGTALIVFNDIYGKELKKIEIKERGNGKIEMNSSNLASGIYTYSIVINNNVIDTKKMLNK